jgi:hypothetical protein
MVRWEDQMRPSWNLTRSQTATCSIRPNVQPAAP